MRNTRSIFLWLVSMLFGLSVVTAQGALSLGDLDLSRMQSDAGPFSGSEQYRSEQGFVLAPGYSLWVDLKGDAEELRATIEPLPGVHGAPLRCRFATANAVREVRVGAESARQEVVLPLKGEELLLVEAIPSGNQPSIRVHITSSSLSSRSIRPEAVGGRAPVTWNTDKWHLRMDGRCGGITELSAPSDPHKMEWIRQAAPWGTGWARIGEREEAWNRPAEMRSTGPMSMEAVYKLSRLEVRVERSLDAGGVLREAYTFKNTGDTPLTFGEGGIGIRIPLVDSYPGAEECLTNRCHVHLWMGGTSSYINAMRMGGDAPHLGLVLTEGSLTSYSIHDRITHSNDRGQFVVHPSPVTLGPGQSRRISWAVFWHGGWHAFWAKAQTFPGFLRVEAERLSIAKDDVLHIRVRSQEDLSGLKVSLNGNPIAVRGAGQDLRLEIKPVRLGEQLLEVDQGRGPALLRAYVGLKPSELIAQRVRFILEHQQKHAPGDRLDGAYLIYDNETGQTVYDGGFADHNAGRERLAMGTLVALYAPLCRDADFRKRIDQSLQAYSAFVARELQNPAGMVFNDVGRSGPTRMYNFPWVAQFHLAMYAAYQKPEYLRRALDTCREYYARGGERFYCIGMPVSGLLNALGRAGWGNERKEMEAAFARHADTLIRFGAAYPKHEVNYEQSIVGPAAQLMLEMYQVSHDARYLRGAEDQVKRLELFGGQQPDYHLHDIAIRHWDDYWFGKRQLYGDTFPHYWSTITATVFGMYAMAENKPDYRRRAENIFYSNFSEFTPDGRASCAYVYPLTVNGQAGRFSDPWANDQDWALVNYLNFVQSEPAP